MKQLKYIMTMFGMAPFIVFNAITRECDRIIANEDKLLADEKKLNEQKRFSVFNPERVIKDAKAIKAYLESKD